MGDRMLRIEDLANIELNSTSALREWTKFAREHDQAMGWECHFAGGVVYGALRPLTVVRSDDRWMGEASSAVVARRIQACFNRAAEHHVSSAKLLTKAFTLFEINYLDQRPKPSKPAFNLNG